MSAPYDRTASTKSLRVGVVALAVLGGCTVGEFDPHWLEGEFGDDSGILALDNSLSANFGMGILEEPEGCVRTDSFHQLARLRQTNVLVVVDRSIDRGPGGADRVRAELDAVYMSLPDVGWQLKMISSVPAEARVDTRPPIDAAATLDDFLNAYDTVESVPPDGRRGLEAAMAYLSSEGDRWIDPDTESLVTVFITDDDYVGTQAELDRFIDNYRHGAPRRFVSSIVHTRRAPRGTHSTACEESGALAREYTRATASLRGTVVDLCDGDWTSAFARIGEDLPLIHAWPLSAVPEEASDEMAVFVDGREAPMGSWFYQADRNVVHLVPVLPPDSWVDITYPVACAG